MDIGQQCHISCGLRHATTPSGTPGQAGRELQVGSGGGRKEKAEGFQGAQSTPWSPEGPAHPSQAHGASAGSRPQWRHGQWEGPRAPGLAAAHQPPTSSSPAGCFSLTWGFLWQSPAGRAPETAIKCSPQLQATSVGSRCGRATCPRNLSGLLRLLGVPRRRLPQLG